MDHFFWQIIHANPMINRTGLGELHGNKQERFATQRRGRGTTVFNRCWAKCTLACFCDCDTEHVYSLNSGCVQKDNNNEIC